MAPCRTRTETLILAAAGERIVAFARSGKPPGSRFCQRIELIPDSAEGWGFSPDCNGF